MNETIISALTITLLGMVLVFAAIILLWGLMALLTYLGGFWQTPRNNKNAEPKITVTIKEPTQIQKRAMVAAVAAVAVALAQEQQEQGVFPLPSTAIVSAWQAVARSNVLRRGRVR